MRESRERGECSAAVVYRIFARGLADYISGPAGTQKFIGMPALGTPRVWERLRRSNG